MARFLASALLFHLTSWMLLELICNVHQCAGMNRWLSPELCCGQTPLAANDLKMRCCGGNISYSSADSMCCWEASRGHYTVSLPPPPTNSPPADARSDDEADDGLKLSSNSVINSKFQSLLHLNQNPSRFLSCCADNVYDFRFYVCCQGVIRKQRVTGNTGCCGRDTYDPYIQLCCDGDILPKNNFASYCCGKKSYDRNVEVCCNGVIHRLPTSDDANNVNCCAHQTYDNRRQLCCHGNRLDKASNSSYCCGSTQFNWERQLCCKGNHVVDKTSPTQFCCGSNTFDMSTHICCNDHIIAKNVTSSARLRQSLLVDDEELMCCGSRAYSYEKEMCCNGKVVPKAVGQQRRCCGQSTYDEESEMCCDGTVSAKLTRAEDCCGSRVFNVQTQVCCQQVIHNVTSDSLLYCCGNSTFDPQTETCCAGRKLTRKSLLDN